LADGKSFGISGPFEGATGSSPVVPAIPFKQLKRMGFKVATHNFTHTFYWTVSLSNPPRHEFVLSGDHLVEVFIRVQIEGSPKADGQGCAALG
jgi:hypothetical protein